MSQSPSPVLVAAAPALISAIQAVQQFFTNIGTDPLLWAVKVPGAGKVLLGSLELQLPVVAAAEAGALQTLVNTQTNGWISQLQALK